GGGGGGEERVDVVGRVMRAESRRAQVGRSPVRSTDKGYCQLLSPTLQIRDYFQHRWLDQPFIEQEFGVKPEQLSDYWGLTGISSSQVTGIPGIGPKAAKEILSQFDDIEQAFLSPDLPKKYRTKFDQHIELARRCKRVSALKTDIELGFNLQDLRFTANEAR
ncbi:flap endonuclease Xni, partial [Vibrio vulnificus]|uniref:5'-3' exonuclease H3TH domain-containing protein n=1 Tax=Vibrio vulnificus TaxID=672 RepID=UPI00237B5DC1